MLFAHPRASDGYQLQGMRLRDEKYDAICDFQIHVHHVPLMCGVQYVTKDLGLQVHPEPKAGLHLDAY